MQMAESALDSRKTHAWLREMKIDDAMVDKKRLVEVPYTATLAHTLNALVANQVGSVPVAAPPGHWIGAGGSMILESDKQTGVIRKHYIGMVTMFDILAHIAEEDENLPAGGADLDLDMRLSVPVSSIIGHSMEGLNLWTMNPNTRYLLFRCFESVIQISRTFSHVYVAFSQRWHLHELIFCIPS